MPSKLTNNKRKSTKFKVTITPPGKKTPGGIKIERPGHKPEWTYHDAKSKSKQEKLASKIIKTIKSKWF